MKLLDLENLEDCLNNNFFKLRSGKRNGASSYSRSIPDTRSEPGCLEYDLYQLIDDHPVANSVDPSVMFFYENWTNTEALQRHMNTTFTVLFTDKLIHTFSFHGLRLR